MNNSAYLSFEIKISRNDVEFVVIAFNSWVVVQKIGVRRQANQIVLIWLSNAIHITALWCNAASIAIIHWSCINASYECVCVITVTSSRHITIILDRTDRSSMNNAHRWIGMITAIFLWHIAISYERNDWSSINIAHRSIWMPTMISLW